MFSFLKELLLKHMKLILASVANLELSRRVETRFAGLVVNTPALCQQLGRTLTERAPVLLSKYRKNNLRPSGMVLLTQDLTFKSTLLLGSLSTTSLWIIPV